MIPLHNSLIIRTSFALRQRPKYGICYGLRLRIAASVESLQFEQQGKNLEREDTLFSKVLTSRRICYRGPCSIKACRLKMFITSFRRPVIKQPA